MTVPKEVVKALGWKEGERLEIGVDDSTMTARRPLKR
jgi:bifunctional DNA-binding transcriptional regulator/antitoxin component of YhaV-PrlF toxin-antitoxin module